MCGMSHAKMRTASSAVALSSLVVAEAVDGKSAVTPAAIPLTGPPNGGSSRTTRTPAGRTISGARPTITVRRAGSAALSDRSTSVTLSTTNSDLGTKSSRDERPPVRMIASIGTLFPPRLRVEQLPQHVLKNTAVLEVRRLRRCVNAHHRVERSLAGIRCHRHRDGVRSAVFVFEPSDGE